MQNRYAGDVGDFGKYGLLRKLCGELPLSSLGVVWYLMSDELGPDGRHIGYLESANAHEFQDCDPKLYRALQKVKVCREVAAIERSGVLGDAAFFSKPVDTGNREAWLREALNAVAGRDLVFLDPDNGLEVKSTRLNWRRGGKFCGYEEMGKFLSAGASVVLYQHFNRSARAEEQLTRLCRELTGKVAPPLPPFALRFHRGTGRAFLVLPQQRHAKRIQRGIKKLMASPWKRHFTRPECEIAPLQDSAG
ncbi:MAG: hypothetical protein Q8N47_23635 [Bryobacterales bacterium]|nr:hypothetical protein [Bryobacterales bacterium]